MEIAPAHPTQAVALRELHLASWEAAYEGCADEAWHGRRLAAHADRDWAEILRLQADRGGGVLSAESDGRVVGLCQYGPTEDDDDAEDVGQIQRLYVHPARQRAGIGRSLLTAAINRLRQAGADEATLWVLETDLRARTFYERLGWGPDGSRKTRPPTDLRYRVTVHPAAG